MLTQNPVPTQQPQFRMVSDEQVRDLHYASLHILSDIGMKIDDQQVRALLLDAGAWESGDRVKIPEKLVVDAISSAPSRITMYNRLGELTMPLEKGKVFFGSGSDTTFTLDLETGERRRTVAQDAEDFARLGDALTHIDFVMSMSNPSDVYADDLYLHSFVRMLRGSVKPNLYTVQNRKDLEDIYRIGVAIAGGEQELRDKPFFLQYAEPISPLYLIEESLQKLVFCAEKGIPVCYIPSTNPGGGGPITLAGSIALGNAETLVGLIVSQLIRPNTPYLYGMNTAALDMKSTIVSYGSPEWSMGMATWTELARYYNLPVWGYGGATDSKVVDAQAGIEATFSIFNACLSRCTLVHDVAYMEYGSTSSKELLVIADEIIRMCRFYMQGVTVDRNTLALDAIERVQPGGGFIADDHTYQNYRTHQWAPSVFDRNRFDLWESKGSKDLSQQANERAKEILSSHQVPPLGEDVEALIQQIFEKREKERGG